MKGLQDGGLFRVSRSELAVKGLHFKLVADQEGEREVEVLAGASASELRKAGSGWFTGPLSEAC